MDLNYVIAELRAELETLKQITSSLEKLHEIRKRRELAQLAEIAEAGGKPQRRRVNGTDATHDETSKAAASS